jgi:tetratricopeptide (TPR) repeat protein
MLEEVVAFNLQQIGPTQWFTLDSQYWLGRAYEARGQPESTVELYDRILPLIVPRLPSEASQFCSIGIADFFVRQRDYPRAAAAFRSIHERLSRFPPNGSWSFERGLRVTAGAQGWPAAAEFCRRHLDCAPESGFSWLLKAWVFRSVGDETNYAATVRQVLARSRQFPDRDQHVPIEVAALGPWPFSPAELEQVSREMTALQDRLPTRDGDLRFWGNRALAHMQFRLQQFSDALDTLATIEDRVGKDPYALFIRAACLHSLGKSPEARAVFETAAALSERQLPELRPDTEPFSGIGQIYQHLVMRRETEGLLTAQKKPAR